MRAIIVGVSLLAYLLAARELPAGDSRTFEIGGTEVVTYADLIREYARQTGLRRWLIFVPVLTPYLSGLWLALVTPAAYEVGRHLIEGLKNPTVVRDRTALEVFVLTGAFTDEEDLGIRISLAEDGVFPTLT